MAKEVEYVEVDMELVKKYHGEKKSIRWIADHFGIHHETVNHWVKAMYATGELEPRNRGSRPVDDSRTKRREEREKTFIEMRGKGRTLEEIATALGISLIGAKKIASRLIASGEIERLTSADVVKRDNK